MQEDPVADIHDYLRLVNLWGSHTRLYRGVSNPAFELRPSLGRIRIAPTGMEHVPGASLRERANGYERELLKDFKRRSLPFLKFTPRSEMEWLCLAQHYGVPTRLLDWTTNPLVALFFACEQLPDLGGAVYVCEQSVWATHVHEVDPFEEIDYVRGIWPEHADERFTNQGAMFTLQPDYTQPLDSPHVRKLIFDRRAKAEMQWQLSKFGFRASFIYPGLDGVAKDVKASCEILRLGTVAGGIPIIPGQPAGTARPSASGSSIWWDPPES